MNIIRTFLVIFIIVSNWYETVWSSHHNNFDNGKMSSINRLRHHNIHHNHHYQQNSQRFSQQQLNYHLQPYHHQEYYNNRTLNSINKHKQNYWPFKYNKISEAVQNFPISNTNTIAHPLNYNQHNLHQYRSRNSTEYNPIESLQLSDVYNQKKFTNIKVKNTDLSSLSWLKSNLGKKSSTVQNFKPTISPFNRKDINISSKTYGKQQTSSSKNSNAKNDNSKAIHRNDEDDYYYYDGDDDDNEDDDEEEEEEDSDDDDNVYNKKFDVTLQKKIHRRTINKNLDRLTEDYQFDEPLIRISTEKTETLTEQKWRELGTAEAVEISRRKSLNETQLVSAHITRVHLEALCKYPRPKIIQINEASKRYVPHCTVLYRCGDDTGCCHSDTHKCVAKKTTTVDLYFYAIQLGMKDPVVETLAFLNHTECHCIEKYKLSKINKNNILSTAILNDESNQFLIDNKNENNGNISNKNVSSHFCRCTKHFDIFFEENSDDNTDYHNEETNIETTRRKCWCDCLTNNTVCQRLKKGQEGFLIEDQRCIINEQCTIPTCDFGDYTKNVGRCPRGKEKRTIHRRNYNYFD